MYRVRGFLMGFLDLVFLSAQANSTTFLNSCDRGEGLRTTTCLKAVAGVIKGMLPVIDVCSNNVSFCVSRI